MLNRTPRLCSRCRDSLPPPPDPAAALDFAPVPRVKPRHDGWTPSRQKNFIAALADTGSVTHAARAVNMATEGAYALRRQPGASAFSRAWDAALDRGVDRLVAVTMERAIHGTVVPVFYHGQRIGERTAYNDRLAMFHLRHRLPDSYGALVPPGRGTKSYGTECREAGWDRDAEDAEAERNEGVFERVRLRLEGMHVRWRAILSKDPAKIAAYELLFGPAGENDARQGDGIRFSRFPPELSHALMGITEEDEVREKAREEALRLAYDQPG